MLIAEIFHSLQGEGELTGVPSVFIRTSGCNLRCAWCDTPYASWQPEGKPWTIDAIIGEVLRYPSLHVVLTGGEPMVAPGIADLAAGLIGDGASRLLASQKNYQPDKFLAEITSLAAHHGVSRTTIALAWLLKHPSGIMPITMTRAGNTALANIQRQLSEEARA